MNDYRKVTKGIVGLFILLLAACQQLPEATTTGPTVTPIVTDSTVAEPVDESEAQTDPTEVAPPTATSASEATEVSDSTEGPREITILYTNDEHGWMEGTMAGSSAANLLGLWRSQEGFDPDGDFLLLSGGDLWTGPAISTWFSGASMVEVMNAMGYHAAAVGNHEFDFGLATLSEHAMASNFPLLSANIRYRSDGTTPVDLGILPYIIREVNGIKVGIIGLSTTSTPFTTKPDNVAAFEFIGYEEALREIVPLVQAEGAQLIVVPGHICRFELIPLARQIADLGVHMLGGGHCNELFVEQVGDILVLEGGASLASYAMARFTIDPDSGTVELLDSATRLNNQGVADPAVDAVIRRWLVEAEVELNKTIGYLDDTVARRGLAMQDLIVEAWLEAYPAGDVALTNFGGMRADIPAGEVTVGTIVGVMPFDNVIIEVLLTGDELIEVMQGRRDNTAVGGMSWSGSEWLLDESGEPLDPDVLYSVLVNDFMYTGGDGYRFQEYDPAGYDTSIHWRQPVIDWIERQESSAAVPLDSAIDELGR